MRSALAALLGSVLVGSASARLGASADVGNVQKAAQGSTMKTAAQVNLDDAQIPSSLMQVTQDAASWSKGKDDGSDSAGSARQQAISFLKDMYVVNLADGIDDSGDTDNDDSEDPVDHIWEDYGINYDDPDASLAKLKVFTDVASSTNAKLLKSMQQQSDAIHDQYVAQVQADDAAEEAAEAQSTAIEQARAEADLKNQVKSIAEEAIPIVTRAAKTAREAMKATDAYRQLKQAADDAAAEVAATAVAEHDSQEAVAVATKAFEKEKVKTARLMKEQAVARVMSDHMGREAEAGTIEEVGKKVGPGRKGRPYMFTKGEDAFKLQFHVLEDAGHQDQVRTN